MSAPEQTVEEEGGKEGVGVSASADRATDASHGAPDGSPPFGSVSTDAGEPRPQPTPGPWKAVAIPPYELEDGTLIVTGDETHHYAIRYQWHDDQNRRCTRFVAEVHKTYNHEGECEPNARLIAAAPELLEALEEFSREYDGFEDGTGDTCRTLIKARAAIARATGAAS